MSAEAISFKGNIQEHLSKNATLKNNYAVNTILVVGEKLIAFQFLNYFVES